eukprot:250710_1
MFVDDDKYYSKHCGNMQLGLGTKILETHKQFCIFGYPGCDFANAQKNELYGYAMKSDAEEKGIELIKCENIKGNFTTKTEYTLRQRHVDASAGQSGSAVFITYGNNKAIIFAVHVGGHAKDHS